MNVQRPPVPGDAARARLEASVLEAVSSGLAIVHLWAPWCPDCLSEFGAEGWGPFVRSQPAVKFIFVAVWSENDGRDELASHGLAACPNLIVLSHPNPSRKKGERMEAFLGRSVAWIPTTWAFREGEVIELIDRGTVDFPALRRTVG